MSDLADAASTPDVRGEWIVYVANAESHDIAILALDRASGALREVDRHATGGKVMPLALRPDRRVLYASIRDEPYRVLSLSVDTARPRIRPALIWGIAAPGPEKRTWTSFASSAATEGPEPR